MADTKWTNVDGGNWNDAGNWDNGVPDASTNAIIDAASFNATGKTITVNAAANMLNFDCSAADVTFTIANSAYAFNVYGNLVLGTNLLTSFTSTGYLYFKSTATGKTITANSCTQEFNRIYFDGSGGEWTNQDAWNMGSSVVYLTNGTWITNNQTITTSGSFNILTGTKTLTLGSSSFNTGYFGSGDGGHWAGLTLNAGTSHITCTTFVTSTRLRTFYDVTALTGGSLLYGNFHNLTFNQTTSAVCSIGVYSTVTISGTLTINGYNATNYRAFIYGNTIGTSVTITINTGGTVSFSNVDFRDINLHNTDSDPYDASAITGLSGDCGGNSGITFTTPQKQYYKHLGGGTCYWKDPTKWYSDSGLSVAGRVPLPQDDNDFLEGSFDSTTTLVVDCPRIGKSIDMSGVDQAVTMTLSNAVEQYGSHILSTNITPSGNYVRTMMGRGSFSINLSGKTIYDLTINAYGGTYTNGASYVFRRFTQTNGTWVMGNYTHESNETAAATAWTYTAGTVTPNESTIKFNPASGANNITFAGGGKTYYNIWFSGSHTGNFDITGSNTFNNLKIDAGRKVRFTAGTTTTINSMTATGTAGNLITIGSVTSAAHTITLASGQPDVECDYLSLSYSQATANKFYAGDNSTDGGNNTGWMFYSSFKPLIMFM